MAVGGALNEGLVDGNHIIDCSLATFQSGSKKLRLQSDHNPLGRSVLAK